MADNAGTKWSPDWCMRPGVHLREMLDDSGLTGDFGTTTMAKLSGLTVETVEGVLSGKKRITKDIAAALAAGSSPLRVSAQMWLNLERHYREGLKAGKADISDG